MNKALGTLGDTVIRASAGTGKTFQLSNRFIGLAARQTPDNILATTFTRKAAGEILDRVLVRLAEAALQPKKLAELALHVGGPAIDLARCQGMLREMIRHLHRLRVSTLDSFFVQIAQSFSLELGLPPGWVIAEEIADQSLRAEAIRNVLQNESTQDVVRLMHLLTKGEASRSVSEQIASLVKALYGIYTEAPAVAWKSLPRHKQLGATELFAAMEALAAVPTPGDKRYQKAIEKDLEITTTEDWESFLEKGLGAAVLDGTETYYKKPIPAEIVAVYRPLVQHAKAAILARIADQTEATRDLLERFDAAYQRLKTRTRSLRFEDLTRRLSAAAISDRLEEVVYRLDGQVAHLLLDEFQDTSALQWRVLRPFAQRVIRGGEQRSFFCVGDVKQAIYGWRGGVAEIFEALENEFAGLPSQALNESFRSAPVVIDCVNQVFEDIANNPVLQKCPAAAQKWSQRFTRHTTARMALPGYCRMVTAPLAADGEEQGVVTLRQAAEEVARLHEQSPDLGVGVLVRRNAAVARLIFELRLRGIDASEEGGNPLTDSPAVQVICSLLTLADHPGDTTARFHVATSPLAQHVELTDYRDSTAAWNLAEKTRRQLMVDGYGPVLDRWAKELAAVCDRRDVSRLEQLVEMAYGYEDQATTRPGDFVTLVRQQKVEDPTSARVRVMTVHQAKGLQFDIVVLPELDVGIGGQPPEIVTGCPKPAAPIERVCRYVSKDLRAILPAEFQRMFAAHEERIVEESLCLLYVALTRAVHSLHLVIAPSKNNERSIPYTFAGVLRTALVGGEPIAMSTVLYEHGEADWFKKTATAKPQAAEVAQAVQVAEENSSRPMSLPQRPKQPTRGLDHRSPSRLEGGGRVNLVQQLRQERGQSLDRGILLHAWFEQIHWLEDGEPDDDTLNRVARALKLDHLDLTQLVAQFRAALQKPAVDHALRLATYRQPEDHGGGCRVHVASGMKMPRWEIQRERSFAIRDDDVILSGIFDRLVVLYDGDRAVGADVLDYKTDDLPADDPRAVDARVKHYRPQLEAYRRAAAKLLGLEPASVSARLLFTGPGISRRYDEVLPFFLVSGIEQGPIG
ncbi:MAG: UvrD-helicase domain-containing protein [Planctomycetota bacterium]